MRPGLHGNLLRNRGHRSRRLHNRPHTFSLSRLLMIVFVGAIMFIPGLTLTILGLQHSAVKELAPDERIMFKAVGPTLCVLGLGTLFGAGVYYCCYGVGNQPTPKNSNSHQHALMSGDSEHHKHHGHHHHHHEENGGSATPDRRHSYSCHDAENDTRVPLAYFDDDTIKEPLSPVSIRIDNVGETQGLVGLDIPEVRISPCSSYQGSILNSETGSPSSPT